MSNPRRPDVDERCYELAEHFLSETPGSTEDDIWALARSFQLVAEGFCLGVEDRQLQGNVEPPGGMQ